MRDLLIYECHLILLADIVVAVVVAVLVVIMLIAYCYALIIILKFCSQSMRLITTTNNTKTQFSLSFDSPFTCSLDLKSGLMPRGE
jgi:hypothetical protein